MNLAAKHQILSKFPVIKLSLNKPYNVLACVAEGNQHVSFFSLNVRNLDEDNGRTSKSGDKQDAVKKPPQDPE